MRSHGVVPNRSSSHLPRKRKRRMARTNCIPSPATAAPEVPPSRGGGERRGWCCSRSSFMAGKLVLVKFFASSLESETEQTPHICDLSPSFGDIYTYALPPG